MQGWLLDGRPGSGAVLLLHGVHANRLAMVERARFLAAAGYAVLLIDFQAHGESIGRNITFGAIESLDAAAAVQFLRAAAPGERVGVVAASMGGAAALLAEPPLPIDALIIEQVYPTIDEALDNRLHMYLGAFGAVFKPMLLQEMSWHLGLAPARLRPIDHIDKIGCPVLEIAGELDRHTTLAQSKALFAAAKSPKQLWIVDGAAHVDLERFAGAEYHRRVFDFLDPLLQAPR